MEGVILLCGDNCIKCPRYNVHSETEMEKVAHYDIGQVDRIILF